MPQFPLPLIFKMVSPKDNDNLLDKHSTVIKFRKFNIVTILLFTVYILISSAVPIMSFMAILYHQYKKQLSIMIEYSCHVLLASFNFSSLASFFLFFGGEGVWSFKTLTFLKNRDPLFYRLFLNFLCLIFLYYQIQVTKLPN